MKIFNLFLILLLLTCSDKHVNDTDKQVYYVRSPVKGSINNSIENQIMGLWNIRGIKFVNRGKLDNIKINTDVLISKYGVYNLKTHEKLADINYKGQKGMFNFYNLDTLNGNYHFYRTISDSILLLDSGPTIRMENKTPSKTIYSISIVLRRKITSSDSIDNIFVPSK